MTIIIEWGDIWLEYHHVNRANIGAGASQALNITLNRAGRFVGCSQEMDCLGGALRHQNVSIVRDNSSELFHGLEISVIRIIRRNDDVITHSVGHHLLIWMRR